MQDKITLRSYNKINSIEKKIYTIQNYKLPIPVNIYATIYFCVIVLIIFFVGKIIPFISFVPPMLKYIIFPYFLAKYLRQKKLDGKKPYKYLIDYIIFRFNRKIAYERFKKVELPRQIKFDMPRFREG